MNKLAERLVIAGGIVSLLWGLFHVVAIPQLVTEMVAGAGGGAAPGVAELAAFILLCNACITAFLLGIGIVLVVARKSVCQTLVGKLTLGMLTLFWMVRLIAPYFLLPEGVSLLQYISPLDAVFIVMIALYLVPLLLSKKALSG